jgi:hypothetical protein
MDGAVYDTLMVMPVYSASDKTNLRKVELVNAQSGIIPADASIQQVGVRRLRVSIRRTEGVMGDGEACWR